MMKQDTTQTIESNASNVDDLALAETQSEDVKGGPKRGNVEYSWKVEEGES